MHNSTAGPPSKGSIRSIELCWYREDLLWVYGDSGRCADSYYTIEAGSGD